jgi:hypothetical protein
MLPEKVTIDFVLLADFAQTVNGKLTVVGAGWNILNAVEYPHQLPFGIGLGFLVPWAETNKKHAFTFVIHQSEGMELAKGGGEFEVGRGAGIPSGMTQRVVIAVSGQVQVPESGTYEIIVAAAEDEKRAIFEAMPAKR